MPLNQMPNIHAPDIFYQALIDVHQDLSDEQSHELNAALILILANHIGDMTILTEAFQLARASLPTQSSA